MIQLNKKYSVSIKGFIISAYQTVSLILRLLASLSGYQYTRKSWKKEGMELLLDSQFFQMDLPSLQHWRSTVDNLMTHDKTTFKELMGKRNRHSYALI